MARWLNQFRPAGANVVKRLYLCGGGLGRFAFWIGDIERRKSMSKLASNAVLRASRHRHTWFVYTDSNHEAGLQPDFKFQISNSRFQISSQLDAGLSLTGTGRITYKTREKFSMSFTGHHTHSHLHANHYWHEAARLGL
jgi:hypothetical protein